MRASACAHEVPCCLRFFPTGSVCPVESLLIYMGSTVFVLGMSCAKPRAWKIICTQCTCKWVKGKNKSILEQPRLLSATKPLRVLGENYKGQYAANDMLSSFGRVIQTAWEHFNCLLTLPFPIQFTENCFILLCSSTVCDLYFKQII